MALLDAHNVWYEQTAVFDPSYLGLDLTTAADIATIVSSAFLSDPLIPFLVHCAMRAPKRQRIVVETPLGRVTLDTAEHLSPDEIRTRIQRIAAII